MPVDPKYDVITHQRANRRGFLLGITLAELMLITLFVQPRPEPKPWRHGIAASDADEKVERSTKARAETLATRGRRR